MRRNTPERFWARLEKSGECWNWMGSTSGGYGQLSYRRRPVRTHRLAWELAYGPIPAGLSVCHHCDNPRCCRPDHLFLGTPGDNARDCFLKGRSYQHTFPDDPRLKAHLSAFHAERLRRLAPEAVA